MGGATSSTAPVIMNFTEEDSASRPIPLEFEPMTRAPRLSDAAA
jgi:hypothetical protein